MLFILPGCYGSVYVNFSRSYMLGIYSFSLDLLVFWNLMIYISPASDITSLIFSISFFFFVCFLFVCLFLFVCFSFPFFIRYLAHLHFQCYTKVFVGLLCVWMYKSVHLNIFPLAFSPVTLSCHIFVYFYLSNCFLIGGEGYRLWCTGRKKGSGRSWGKRNLD
jgi:hypothetical protein